MARRRWTLVLVPHGAEPSKVIEVSYRAVKAVAAAAGLCAIVLMLVAYATLARTAELARNATLERENALLTSEIDKLSGQVGTLSDTLTQIARRDARIRVLANLDPIDPQVLAAGIGGPSASRGAAAPSLKASAAGTVDVDALIRRANVLASSFREAADSLASHTKRLAATPSIMPTRGWLSSAFSNMRAHPVLHVARAHEGIDVSAPMGTPIEAPGAGTVTEAGWETGYGNVVEIDHGYGIVTKFAHASKVLVKRGQRVARGDRIALVGNSGLATGPHLHYEVHVKGRPVNPMRYVLPDNVVTD